MANRFAAQIEIGGKISRSKKSGDEGADTVLQALMQVISEEGVAAEYGDAAISVSTEAELLAYLDEDSQYLRFRDDRARNGEMEAIETYCRSEGIPYRRWSAMYCGYLGEEVVFDGGNVSMILCDDEGSEQVDGDKVREVKRRVEQYFDPSNSNPKCWDFLYKARELLKELCPPLPESIPNFGIVE